MPNITLSEAVAASNAKRAAYDDATRAEQKKILDGIVAACDEAIRASIKTGHKQATAGYILPRYAPEAVAKLQDAFPGFQIWYGKSMAEGSDNAQINVSW